MKRTAIINAVGLSESLLGGSTPCLNAFRNRGKLHHVKPAFPAVTCTAQSNYLTALTPSQHGIVGNGWYNRELAEVQFWRQSNHLVHGSKLWDILREKEPGFTCANLFWWFNMYSTVDYSITPRPMYPADGRKVFDIYTWPFSIRTEVQRDLGPFPFFGFWGPAAGVDTQRGPSDVVSRWIAESAKWIDKKYRPTVSLIYLPHLDYNLQRLGPAHPLVGKDVSALDGIVGELIQYFEKQGVQVVVLSEYGITDASTPIYLNRIFREQGWLVLKNELGREMLDCGASKVFALVDHQIAHVYCQDPSMRTAVRAVLERIPGVAAVLGPEEKSTAGIEHCRAGDLIAVARENAWFAYYYWLEDRYAPDFARTVDIHRKPGYDPVELFLDPQIPFVKGRILWRLLQKKLGFRMLMDVVPLDATLVKGSHGACPSDTREWPVLITPESATGGPAAIGSTDVHQVLLRLISEQ